MKRLSEENIVFVKELTADGMPYSWYVSLGNRVSDGREFQNYDCRRTVIREYPVDRLPASVQRFIKNRRPEQWGDSREGRDGAVIVEYIYR